MQAVLECKRCGGTLQSTGGKIVYCGYCGSANVFTYVDRFALYNQANYLRQKNEFDRAINVYENILNEHPEDAEASFGIALCKYGIEYVDDPNSGRKIPTCHRTRIKLFSQDEDFKKAVKNADPEVASLYSGEAEQIDSILKKIQELSFNQKKFDVFICYKESDANGERTQTSVVAQDIYEQLSNRGYRVFFARKTLAGMIGSDYEPIIFSALYSAKVMLVVGSNPEEFQGIWVRNEWIRFMERISGGDECTLIPCYKGMSPYDLPSEMVSIQSLDISKIGFIQDITDALERLIKKDKPIKIVEAPVGNVESLKKRAFLFLEEGDFAQAVQYFEKVLDLNPEDSECYWGKLLAGFNCRAEKQLECIMVPISVDKNYRMALRFANEEQAAKYKRYSDLLDEKIAEARRRKEEEERLAREEAERKRKEEEEKARIAAEEAKEREQLLKQKREKKRKRIIKISIAVVIFLVLYLFILEPTGVRIITWFKAYAMDDPAAAKKTMDSYDYDSTGGILSLHNYKYMARYYAREILPDSIDKKIDDIDKKCIGYSKVEKFYDSYWEKRNDIPYNKKIVVRLKCSMSTYADWGLYFDENGSIDCELSSTGFRYDSDEALARYKCDKSLINACKKHKNIEKIYVSMEDTHGILFCIDKKGKVYAEPFGCMHVDGYVNGYVHGYDKEVKYYGLENVEKLNKIEALKMCPSNSAYLYALNSDGEVASLLISTEEEHNNTFISDDGTAWDEIQTELIYLENENVLTLDNNKKDTEIWKEPMLVAVNDIVENNWERLLEEFPDDIKSKEDALKAMRFSEIYINDDDIPEIVINLVPERISGFNSPQSTVYLLYMKDGKADNIQFTKDTTVRYISRSNMIETSNNYSAEMPYIESYVWYLDEFKDSVDSGEDSLWHGIVGGPGKYDGTDHRINGDELSEYCSNGVWCTEEKYEQDQDAIFNHRESESIYVNGNHFNYEGIQRVLSPSED